jgi:hypothetical protein
MSTTVDHNPDDPTMISRHFSDPFARLQDMRQRLKSSYFDITIGSTQSEKYLIELYYDMIFLKNLLAALGVYEEPDLKADVVNSSGIHKVVEAIRSNLLTTK